MNDELSNGIYSDDLSAHWVSIPEREQLIPQLPKLVEKYGIEAILDKMSLSDINDFIKSTR
jgi:hypothetical protein